MFIAISVLMGVKKTTDFLEKATWTLAGALLLLSVLAAGFIPRESGESNNSMMQEQIDNANDPSAVQGNFPMSAPEEESTEE